MIITTWPEFAMFALALVGAGALGHWFQALVNN